MQKVTEDNTLITALKKRDWAAARALVESGTVEVNVATTDGATPLSLSLAPQANNLGLTSCLLAAGADPNVLVPSATHSAQPLLTEMILHEYPASVVVQALDRGADINRTDEADQEPPLFTAVRGNHYQLIELLVRRGADLTPRNAYGQCLLNCIDTFNTRKGIKSLEILLKNGLPPDAQFGLEAQGGTLMEQAVRYGHTEIMITLLNHGSDINYQGFLGRTPLMQGIGDENTYRLLVANGADLNRQDNHGLTALMHALTAADGDAVKFILKYSDQSFDLNLKNQAGETAHQMGQRLLATEKDSDRRWGLERAVHLLGEEMGISENASAARTRE